MGHARNDCGSQPMLLASGCKLLDDGHPGRCRRHTFGSNCMEAGGSIAALKEILGHSDVKTTMNYIKFSIFSPTRGLAAW
jgi:site-specific recombinase XerC